jgi:hypothetical protein
MAGGTTYSWDEMVEVDCLLGSAKEALAGECVLFSPGSVADVLAAIAPRVVRPDRMAAFAAGLAKLRQEPQEMLAAWVAGQADWLNCGTAAGGAPGEAYKLILKA